MRTEFTYAMLEDELGAVLRAGYTPLRCIDYADRMGTPLEKALVLRIDIDFSMGKVKAILDILERTKVRATFFVRLHAFDYNPFSFEGYRTLRRILEDGHELGYHAEIMDQSAIWNEDGAACLRRDLAVLSTMMGTPIHGAASHGGLTGHNNLDFFKTNDPRAFGLRYEAYENTSHFNLFHASRYVSDSEWTRWKAYDNGVRIEGDHRPPSAHAAEGPNVLHLLIHPDTYYVNHCYERER